MNVKFGVEYCLNHDDTLVSRWVGAALAVRRGLAMRKGGTE